MKEKGTDIVKRFTNAMEDLLMKMQEVDNSCMEVTEDISKRDFSLVIMLGKSGNLTMSEISEFLQIPMSTATNVVDKLVSKDYLARYHGQEDRRTVKVGLSKNGEVMFRLLETTMYNFGQAILSGFSEEEKEQFIGFMQRAKQNVIHSVATNQLSKAKP